MLDKVSTVTYLTKCIESRTVSRTKKIHSLRSLTGVARCSTCRCSIVVHIVSTWPQIHRIGWILGGVPVSVETVAMHSLKWLSSIFGQSGVVLVWPCVWCVLVWVDLALFHRCTHFCHLTAKFIVLAGHFRWYLFWWETSFMVNCVYAKCETLLVVYLFRSRDRDCAIRGQAWACKFWGDVHWLWSVWLLLVRPRVWNVLFWLTCSCSVVVHAWFSNWAALETHGNIESEKKKKKKPTKARNPKNFFFKPE